MRIMWRLKLYKLGLQDFIEFLVTKLVKVSHSPTDALFVTLGKV
jgi:hypothetical protein